MKQKIDRKKAMIGGAIAVVGAQFLNRALGFGGSSNNSISYWIGTLMGGALIGLLAAYLVNRSRA